MNYPQLPVMQCDAGCGKCCGPVLCTDSELEAVETFAGMHNVTPAAQGSTCPFYQDGECKVYAVRPFVCRLFGHSPRLVCCKGIQHKHPIEPRTEAGCSIPEADAVSARASWKWLATGDAPVIRKRELKGTRMRRKRRRGDNLELRLDYAAEHLSCACCWETWRDLGCWLEVHHILGGRWGRKDAACNLLVLCRTCHRVLQGGRREESICLRLKADIAEYDRAALVALHANNRERVPAMARQLPWWIHARREARR